MTNPRFDVAGIGNAIVDVLTQTDDALLDSEGLAKGAMTLVDADQARQVYDKVGPAVECSGGSAANTIAVMAGLGAKCAFMGKVKDDAFGKIFAHDIRSLGVHYQTAPAADGPDTANCLVLVTPDAQRTMLTYLGASVNFGPADVDLDAVKDAKVTYLEGYLWDPEDAKQAFRTAAKTAEEAGREVSLSLSDPFCVDRHRADFRRLVTELDFVIGNEQEWTSLYETDDLGAALEQAASESGLIVCTRSGKDVVLVKGDEEAVVPVDFVTPVDATGAGDQFAAGFLYGYVTGADLATCGKMGCVAAKEVIGHMGPRPEADLKELFKAEGLI